ncbi:DUF3576 domain-containing protein [Nocardioides marinus]|jgi:hypothetical protein|nr:DUF3576 domain-containing protein [Nocardioides marinus]
MRWLKILGIISLSAAVSACGALGGRDDRKPSTYNENVIGGNPRDPENVEGSKIWDIFKPSTAEREVQVNRYLWTASLDVLNFLPIQSVDPFTGLIVTGYGTPPGGGRAYRATVHIKDPALDARSLSVALQSKGGPVSASTTRAVEDAILSRARQLRIADKKF